MRKTCAHHASRLARTEKTWCAGTTVRSSGKTRHNKLHAGQKRACKRALPMTSIQTCVGTAARCAFIGTNAMQPSQEITARQSFPEAPRGAARLLLKATVAPNWWHWATRDTKMCSQQPETKNCKDCPAAQKNPISRNPRAIAASIISRDRGHDGDQRRCWPREGPTTQQNLHNVRLAEAAMSPNVRRDPRNHVVETSRLLVTPRGSGCGPTSTFLYLLR